MQKYKQYCPVARASEILADRWTPLIVRELILGSHRFNEIERGLRLYGGLARAYGVAIEVNGDARQDLVAFLTDQLVVAAEVFDGGWNRLTAVRQKVGLPITPNAPPGPGVPGAPGFPVPPGGQIPATPGS